MSSIKRTKRTARRSNRGIPPYCAVHFLRFHLLYPSKNHLQRPNSRSLYNSWEEYFEDKQIEKVCMFLKESKNTKDESKNYVINSREWIFYKYNITKHTRHKEIINEVINGWIDSPDSKKSLNKRLDQLQANGISMDDIMLCILAQIKDGM